MSLITYSGLVKLKEDSVLKGANEKLINPASIDVRLGTTLFVEKDNTLEPFFRPTVDISAKETPDMKEIELEEGEFYRLPPNTFILASTVEEFFLPDSIASEFKLKSSLARAGLDHSLSGWGDPGFNGSPLTLQLHSNLKHHDLILRPGMKIGQIIFWQGEEVPEGSSYRDLGRYNGQKGPAKSKGV